MDQKEQIPKPEPALDEIAIETDSSVDDFIKQLEAKEQDLHITADYTIEVAESDVDGDNVPDFVRDEIASNTVEASPGAGSKPQAGWKTRVYELEQEIVALHERITGLKSERHDIQEKSDRRLKDFENYKYRMDRERRGAFIDQIANLASQMLPVLDNLDRAIESVEKTHPEKSPEFQQFYDGIALVNQQVNEIFAEMGVEPIKSVGETFDPHFHEAVVTEERAEVPANTITEEMLRGWRIGNRVIRHSMVKVTLAPLPAKNGEAVAEQPEPNEERAAAIPEPDDLLPELAEAPDLEATTRES